MKRSTLLPPPIPGMDPPGPLFATSVPTDADRESGIRLASRLRRSEQPSGAASPRRDTSPRVIGSAVSDVMPVARVFAVYAIVGLAAIALGVWTAATLEVWP